MFCLPVCLLLLLGVGVFGTEPPFPYGDHCIVGEQNKYNPHNALAVPWFNVSLDEDPFHRWDQVSAIYAQEIKDLIQIIKDLAYPFFGDKLVDFIDKYMGGWDGKIKEPYNTEIKGIANVTGMKLGEVVMYNIFYEIFTVCTSIVAVDSNDKLYHARNLDFGLFMGWNATTHDWMTTEKLRQMIINVNWIKDGKILYKSVNFAGYIGIYNGLKQGMFTVTMNERFNLNGGFIGILEWFLGMTPNVNFVTHEVRRTLEIATTYQEAYDLLVTRPIVAPAYFILGGTKPNEGSIIVRGRQATADVRHLQMQDPNGWFLLQTNYDPKDAPLYLDDRRTPGRKCMEQMTRNKTSFEGIFNVLSSKTNLNKLTAYTVLMQVDSGELQTFYQKCDQPCWPF